MKTHLALIFTVWLLLLHAVSSDVIDLANQKESSGSQVVEHVVDVISQSCILDNGLFLRRMAYVETRDGLNAATYRAGYHGGIWNIDETIFKHTKNQTTLQSDYDLIKQNLFIDWSNVTWEDLRIPLKSGLAAALYVRSLNIQSLPDNLEIQATIWGSLRPTNLASMFFIDSKNIEKKSVGKPSETDSIKSQISSKTSRGKKNRTKRRHQRHHQRQPGEQLFPIQLVTDCTDKEELDLIIALDFAKLAPVDLARVQMFLETFLKSFHLSSNATRAGLVTKRLFPVAGWYLNSDRPGFTLLNVLKSLTYTPGPTFTGDMLQFIRHTMFNSTNGARPGAARAVLFLTDGITQYQYAKDEANNLGEAGVSLAIVEIDVSGNSTTKDQLNRLVTGPVCRNVLVLRSFASLEKNVEEIKHSLCNAPVQLERGAYTYSCSEIVHIKVPDTSQAYSIQVVTSSGPVKIYASKMYTRPDNAGYDVMLTSTSSDHPVLFIRGLHPVYVTVQANDSSDTCNGNFQVVIKKAETFTGVNGTCIIGGVVRDCSDFDMTTAAHDIVLVRDPSSALSICNAGSHQTEYFPHPLDPHKFIMCDQNRNQFIGLCPVNQSVCVQLTSGCKYANPCTRDAVLIGKLHHSDPCGDPETYILCSHFGVAEVLNCGDRKLWHQDTKVCVFKYVHNVLLGTEVTTIPNPCLHNHQPHAYFPYPHDSAKYIFCDADGNAFESRCRQGIWNQQTQTCVSIAPPVPIG